MSPDFHPDVEQYLGFLDSIDRPDFSDLDPAESRELFDSASIASNPENPEPVGEVEDRTVPGPGDEVPVRIYTPDGDGPFPVLVYLHGGGFVIGNVETVDPTCRALANDADCVVVSVDYRLAPEHPFPAAVEDAYAAVEWAADNAEAVDGDGRLAVGGDSAGGNLSAVVSLLARERGGPNLDYQLLVYPAVDGDGEWPSYAENDDIFLTTADMEFFSDNYLADDVDRYNQMAFPMSARNLADLPPATVMTCEYDPLRDEGDAYADRLEADGVDVEHRRYDGMIHGVVTKLGDPGVPVAREIIADLSDDLRAGFEAASN